MAADLRLPLVVLFLSATQIAQSETLPDPTRPSIDLSVGGAGAAQVVPVEIVPPGLQSIVVSPNHSAAIINGETVSLGGRIGDSTLIEVRESSVVLQNAHGRRVMELFPKVGIKKSEASQQDDAVLNKASGQKSLPDQAVGEIK